MIQKPIEDDILQANRTYTQFIEQVRMDGDNEIKQTIKVVKRLIQVRNVVIERQRWEKWGEFRQLQRGQHREGDMLIEQELKMQTVDGRKTEEMNFIIPAPKVFFKVDLKYDAVKEEEPKQSIRSEAPQPLNIQREAGESIRFGQSDISQSSWLLIISNIVYFEQAESYDQVFEMKDSFREFIANKLKMEERRETYYINFLQNKRKNRLFNKKKDQSTFPLLQKVMLKFPDKEKAAAAEEKLRNQSYLDCMLEVELQEQRQRI